MLKIYVNTWGNYNENGAEGGEWITLPMDSDELEETLQRIADKMGDTDPEWAIHDYEWEDGYGFCAISELDDLREAMDNLDSYTLYDDMDLEEVAEQIVNECYDLPEFAPRYFDYEAFARDLRFDGYVETSYGVLCQ